MQMPNSRSLHCPLALMLHILGRCHEHVNARSTCTHTQATVPCVTALRPHNMLEPARVHIEACGVAPTSRRAPSLSSPPLHFASLSQREHGRGMLSDLAARASRRERIWTLGGRKAAA